MCIMLTVCGISQKAVATAMSLLLWKSFSQTTRHLKASIKTSEVKEFFEILRLTIVIGRVFTSVFQVA